MPIEELTARIERLERIVEERPVERDAHPFWNQIPFGAWLKLSGPGFAVMALGFGMLWNGQQQTTQRILDLQESTSDRILALQRETTDQILELQRDTTNRLLAMQEQLLDREREPRGR